ncbi:MAG: hypothetical protein U0575_10145 [Phycisphaerales bacterium]
MATAAQRPSHRPTATERHHIEAAASRAPQRRTNWGCPSPKTLSAASSVLLSGRRWAKVGKSSFQRIHWLHAQ